MKRAGSVLGSVFAPLLLSWLPWAASEAVAAPRAPPPKPVPAKPLPAPPTLPRIHLEVGRDHLLVEHDVLLGRGDWTAGNFDAFVAFGAPGVPRAIDAHLFMAGPDGAEPPAAAASSPVPIDRAFHRPANARLLLGSSSMAGAVLHLRDASFRWATSVNGAAWLRVRTLLDLPGPDVRTGREVVVRLGAYEGEPYALGSLEVTTRETRPWLTRAEAHLCGSEADTWPLAVRLQTDANAPWTASPPLAPPLPIAPVASVRHASDDLCIRFWTTPR